MNNDYLAHHGIKGQKWGIRRFQNSDGSLTPAGRKRYQEIYDEYKEASRNLEEKEIRYNRANDSIKEHELSTREIFNGTTRAQYLKQDAENIYKYILSNPKHIDPIDLIKDYSEYKAWNYDKTKNNESQIYLDWTRRCYDEYEIEFTRNVRYFMEQASNDYANSVDDVYRKVEYEESLDAYDVAKQKYTDLISNPKYTIAINSGKVYVKNNQSFLQRTISQIKQIASKVSSWISNLLVTSSSKKWS